MPEPETTWVRLGLCRRFRAANAGLGQLMYGPEYVSLRPSGERLFTTSKRDWSCVRLVVTSCSQRANMNHWTLDFLCGPRGGGGGGGPP